MPLTIKTIWLNNKSTVHSVHTDGAAFYGKAGSAVVLLKQIEVTLRKLKRKH